MDNNQTDKPAKYIAQRTAAENAKHPDERNLHDVLRFALSYLTRNPEGEETIKVHSAYALCLMAAGEKDEAERVAFEALTKFPGEVGLYGTLSKILSLLEKNAEAITVNLEALTKFPDPEKFPTRINFFNNLTKALKQSGRHKEAKTWAEQAVAEFPNNIIAAIFLCHMLNTEVENKIRSGDGEGAKEAALRSARLAEKAGAMVSPKPEETSKTIFIILKRLAELHPDSSDHGIGVDHPISPAFYQSLIAQRGLSGKADFILKRNVLVAKDLEPRTAKPSGKTIPAKGSIEPDRIAQVKDRSASRN